ncbi:protein still life, isoform SIF type 1 [Agrilus planipennis]|uniref:Protein still life, isoform SIF type 1 n=1 Tax=Agrilus planipennis TaxID=224129 RepID=A0A1W4WXX1_AGRPL|nr:protein still life, isoform SIF type 1 [Agrilus planipennis]
MGNKLSCSCAPLIRKAYRYEDSPWQTARRRDGHLLRLWAEVFHVSASGAGTVKWQQVSEDLVPVNITCIQDSPECVFHITAYNSQVDKILDVRLVQPGTRIGQASECFVYWKDPMTNDTWGLNFTSPIDAKQFRECCCDQLQSPSFKFSRKASSSYSLKLEPPSKQKFKAKRKPLSTPASPSRASSGREPQCTCMTAEQYARLKAQDPRYRGSSTLPRAQTRSTDTETRTEKVTAATSSTSLYDNVGATTQTVTTQASTKPAQREGSQIKQTRDRGVPQQSQETSTMTSNTATGPKTVTASIGTQNNVGSQAAQTESPPQTQSTETEKSKSEAIQAGGTLQPPTTRTSSTSTRQPLRENVHHVLTNTRSVDYPDMDVIRDAELRAAHQNMLNNNSDNITNRRNKSKSTEDMNRESGMNLDSSTLKRMLKPMPSIESPVTSPEVGRKRYGYYNTYHHRHPVSNGRYSEPESTRPHPRSAMSQTSRFSGSRSSHEIGRGYPGRGLYLELERSGGGGGGPPGDLSPPSDNVIFDNQCYATTPSSSNGNSDPEQHYHGQRGPRGHQHHHQNATEMPTPGSPTSRLLLEYEMHLRNTLAKGMDAESYSLHTFEALLTQSMENLEFAESLPGSNQRSPYPTRKGHRLDRSSSIGRERERDRDRDGYYSDRNELLREREKERERERGYLSDHNTSYSSRCASCIGESSRAQWFRHSDGWRSGSSTYSSTQGFPQPPTGHKRSAWDSLPSLRQDSSLNDSGYKSGRTDSFEQRSLFDRQDSLRSDYMSDRESRYGIVQQASIESADSRLCYLTSSEISDDERMSLTTAVSDEDDGESVMNSPYKAKQTGTAAASFNCTGAVRKAGFLSVKKWLLRKKHQIELARKRGWKGYWVCLKGTTLLFYPCDSREGRSVEAAPKHLIIVDGAIMQPIPEHPKRDYIFCLSTAFGDAYLFQAPCQVGVFFKPQSSLFDLFPFISKIILSEIGNPNNSHTYSLFPFGNRNSIRTSYAD